MMSRTAILIAALFGTAAAFSPSALPMGLRQRAATSKISGYQSILHTLPHGTTPPVLQMFRK